MVPEKFGSPIEKGVHKEGFKNTLGFIKIILFGMLMFLGILIYKINEIIKIRAQSGVDFFARNMKIFSPQFTFLSDVIYFISIY